MPAHVIIIGAGITGLQTALTLARAGFLVSIVAEWWPGDEAEIREKGREGGYASLWAGAHWRTHAHATLSQDPAQDPAHATADATKDPKNENENENEVCAWDLETYKYWMGMSAEERGGRGVGVYTSFQYWNSSPSPSSLWWLSHIPYSPLSPPQTQSQSQPSTSPSLSLSFTTITLHPTLYLSSLLASLLSLPTCLGTFRARLPTGCGISATLAAARTAVASAAADGKLAAPGGRTAAAATETEVFAYVNATGLGAADIVGDKDVQAVRGQIVLVRGEASAVRTRMTGGGGGGAEAKGEGKEETLPKKAELNYVIPRPAPAVGGSPDSHNRVTVLGGTNEPGNYSTIPLATTTQKILAGTKDLAPELLNQDGEFDVLDVLVGLRPGRKGGPRVEVERMVGGGGMVVEGTGGVREEEAGKTELVIHAYGHGGAG